MPLPAVPEAVERYIAYLKEQRRASEHTLKATLLDLEHLIAQAGEHDLAALGVGDIRHYVARLHAGGLAGQSIARHLSTWRGFYRWMVRHCGLKINPVEGVRAPRSGRRLPNALSVDQAQALLDPKIEGALEARDSAMFELLYSSGLRVAELAALNIQGDMDRAEGMVRVQGKRSKIRIVPVGSQALLALEAWLTARPFFVKDTEPALFVTRTGLRMSTSAIRSRLSLRVRTVGLGVHVHPHMLRHSFASHMLQSSGDLRAVQELLGHASIRSTQVYTHLDFQHLAQVYDAAHPRAKKDKCK